MKRYYVAFYRGTGDWADRIVRFATRSAYSHCELIWSETRPKLGTTVECLSASRRDGGVRLKQIELKPAKWCVYDVTWAPDGTWDRAADKLGAPYELWSLVTTHLFNFRRGDRDRWFCSELIAYALRLDMPHAYSPGDLLRAIRDHSDTYEAGRRAACANLWDDARGLDA
ncbi:hypothetical protein [uncultured Jannaschia sp.]|uniref:hypothetical protein n=1 Tax=uncultured Jannaschia sp. TaxID=293347 RepID=UPI002607DAC0|nr:hypothetical protein [uncultured Jannaschia sp.]